MHPLLLLSIIVSTGIVSPAIAQSLENRPGEYKAEQSLSVPVESGITAQPAKTRDTGLAGQRQTRQQVAQDTGIEPMGRISNRIQNRVQARIRNRIDRYYDPQANATTPFIVAGDQLRTTARPRR
ncbi:hypothetical protein [Sphingomonas sp. Leaf30]|jgi:hypothetical protein|uniref:hypothetical protein n=1 Tax=Sphingomonas sp. Leaf30 TaxID=1736213 RepID=UPI000AA358DB|nr:hypothetical protein [Sphingomonas sp. Leaf30]